MSVPYPENVVKQKRELENAELLVGLQGILELPMVILSFIMLLLFILELTFPLPEGWNRTFNLIQWFIWIAFVIEYVIEISLASDKAKFLKENWLMTLAIILPVFRIFRIARAARATRSIGTLRVVTVGNRSINKLRILFERRRLQYLAAVVTMVTILAAAGVYFLERNIPNANIRTFGSALWWSSGTVTTVGTELFPISTEGRVLAIILMVFGVSVFGYIAGSLASLFVHLDETDKNEEREVKGPEGEDKLYDTMEQIKQLQTTVAALNETLQRGQATGSRAPYGDE